MARLPALLLLTGIAACAPCLAQTVYQCVGAHGESSYQSTPCPGERGRQIVLDTPAPSSPPPPAPADSTPPPTAAVPPPAPGPAAPVPTLYQCVRATDGKTYTSTDGHPPGYYAPLGIVGLPTLLTEQYTAANGMGHAKPNAAMVSGYYTYVQDSCREMSTEETCAALRADWTRNEHALSRAFKSDQAPLLARETELRAQLQGCGGP
ncbi:MAG: hypothetical protein RSP_03280 [Rhodanobacter sp.]